MVEVGEKYTCGVMTENRTWRRFTYVSRKILEPGGIDTSAVKKSGKRRRQGDPPNFPTKRPIRPPDNAPRKPPVKEPPRPKKPRKPPPDDSPPVGDPSSR